MKSTTRVCGAIVALGVTVATSLGVASPSGAGEPAPDVAVTIDSDRFISMPETIRPGVNTFDITSEKTSSFQLAQPAEGYTVEEAVRDIEQGLNKGRVRPLKRFERNVTLYGGATSRPDVPATFVVSLPAGTYWAVDVRTNDADKFFTFTVEGEDTGNTMSEVKTIRAVGGEDWAKRPRTIPRTGMLGFGNDSTENHFIAMAKLKKGKDVRDFRRWIRGLMRGEEGRPPVKFGVGYDNGVASPGVEFQTNYTLPRGRYVVTCWWPDADMDVMPHAFMGMIRGIRVG